jgi:hypothetical protein
VDGAFAARIRRLRFPFLHDLACSLVCDFYLACSLVCNFNLAYSLVCDFWGFFGLQVNDKQAIHMLSARSARAFLPIEDAVPVKRCDCDCSPSGVARASRVYCLGFRLGWREESGPSVKRCDYWPSGVARASLPQAPDSDGWWRAVNRIFGRAVNEMVDELKWLMLKKVILERGQRRGGRGIVILDYACRRGELRPISAN